MAGTGAIQLTVFDGRRGIVRVSHRVHRPAISLLCTIKNVGGSTVGIRTVISSGMIGKVKDFMGIPKMKPEERRYMLKRRKRMNSPIKTPGDISRVLEQIVRWTYYIFFVLAVYFILIAAFSYLTAGGDPEKLKKAHSSLLWAFVAIAIALISVGAAQIVKSFITPPA